MVNTGIINVKDYGAVGDGSTDDTDAVQNAINAGTSIFFPSGTYLVNGSVSIGGGTMVFGAGSRSSIIRSGATSAAALVINKEGSTLAHLGFDSGGGQCGVSMTSGPSSGPYRTSLLDCRFVGLPVGVSVSGPAFWSKFVGCEFRDCGAGIATKADGTNVSLNATSIIGCIFFQDARGPNYPVNIAGSDGLTLDSCHFQEIGPRFEGCGKVLISGGYFEAYKAAALSAVSSSLDIRGVFWPPGTVTAIDNETFTRSYGVFPPDVQYCSEAEVVHDYPNLFPDPGCSTDIATAQWGSHPTGMPLTPAISAAGHLGFTNNNQDRPFLAKASFQLPPRLVGIGVYCKGRVGANSGSCSMRVYPQVGDPSGGMTQFSANDWTYARLADDCDPQKTYHLVFAQQNHNDFFEIDELIIVPYKACVGRVLIGPTLPVREKTGPEVEIPVLATVEVLRFTAADQGVWLIECARTGEDRFQKSTSWCVVLANAAAFVSPLYQFAGNLSASGPVVSFQNTGGVTVFMRARAKRVGG